MVFEVCGFQHHTCGCLTPSFSTSTFSPWFVPMIGILQCLKLEKIFTGPTYTNYFWALRISRVFTGILFQIKLHLLSTVLIGNFKTPQELWNPQNLGNFWGLTRIRKTMVYQTEPFFTDLGQSKLSWFLSLILPCYFNWYHISVITVSSSDISLN